MNIEKLFQMQQELDRYIEEEHELESADLFNRKVLALLVEIGELANETRCFKFWSTKGPSERSVILEEFVDGVHFILSLGLELGFTGTVPEKEQPAEEASDQFLLVTNAVHAFQKSQTKEAYQWVMNRYFALGSLLGFTAEEVEQAYVEKNEVNFKRQKTGY